jgi:hypothetical protein
MARSGKIKFIRTTKDVTMEYDLIDDRIVRTDRTINGNPINLEDPNLSPEVLESIVGLGLTSNGLLNVNVSNGLTVSSSIELGGDLTRNTFIHGNTYQLSFDNLDFMVSNSNSFDIKSNFVSIDSGTGSSQYIADSDISVNSFNGSLYLGASQSYIHIDGDEMIVNSSNEKGLQYTEDLTNTFVDNSLITKKFLESSLDSFQSIFQSSNSVNITYQELYDKTVNGELVVGQWYRLTDYKSVNFLNGWQIANQNPIPMYPNFNPREIYEGETEVLMLQATSPYGIAEVGYSETFNGDIVQYEPYVNKIGVDLQLYNGQVLPDTSVVSGFDLQWDGTNVYFEMPNNYPALFGHYFYLYCEFDGGSYYQDGAFDPLTPGVSVCQYPYTSDDIDYGYPKSMSRIKVENDGYKIILLDLDEDDFNNYDLDTLYINTVYAIGDSYGWITRRQDTHRNIDVPFDFRSRKYRRFEINLSSIDSNLGINYWGIGDNPFIAGSNRLTTGNYKDFKVFANEGYDALDIKWTDMGGPDHNWYRGYNDNNVWFGFMYKVNIKTLCANNTIDSEFIYNNIKDQFHNNIISLYFTYNNIGYYFSNNQIGNNFSNNQIGNNFYFNQIGYYFSNNFIGNIFYNNKTSVFFEHNKIGNLLCNNTIGDNFNENVISNNFNGNVIGDGFIFNSLGNNFNGNTIALSFSKNNIGEQYQSNQIGDYFSDNTISNVFLNNQISTRFEKNRIGNGFENNTIGDDFLSNCIGNRFNGNSISDYFNNNEIGNIFLNNDIGINFYSNKIGNVGFTNNTIGNVFGANFIFDYFNSNIIGNDFIKNIINADVDTVNFISATRVYGNYNCTISKKSDGNLILSYIDGTNTLQYDIING